MSKYMDLLEKLKEAKCGQCGGLGEVNDADPGDMYYNEWTCPKCFGSGFDSQVCPPVPTKEMVKARGEKDRDVHTEHCCARHGCKYGDDKTCPVVLKKKTQSYPCENCVSDADVLLAIIGRLT
jgi:hypothetical protein